MNMYIKPREHADRHDDFGIAALGGQRKTTQAGYWRALEMKRDTW